MAKFLSRFRSQTKYEEKFSNAIFADLRANDIVWDVGANIGYYTKVFAERVGSSGVVIAFEPNRSCVEKISGELLDGNISNVILKNCALGDSCGEVYLELGTEEMAVDSKVSSSKPTSDRPTQKVEMVTGDHLIQSGLVPEPSVVKLDVEGFELECVRGMSMLIGKKSVRSFFIEVHFSVLESRGFKFAPLELEKVFRDAGYNVAWLDSSHIMAKR